MTNELVFLPRNIDSCLNVFESELDHAVDEIFNDLVPSKPARKVVSLKQPELSFPRRHKATNASFDRYKHAHLIMSNIQERLIHQFGDGWEDALLAQTTAGLDSDANRNREPAKMKPTSQ